MQNLAIVLARYKPFYKPRASGTQNLRRRGSGQLAHTQMIRLRLVCSLPSGDKKQRGAALLSCMHGRAKIEREAHRVARHAQALTRHSFGSEEGPLWLLQAAVSVYR